MSGTIEGVFLHYRFCRNKNCEMSGQCLRDRHNLPLNTLGSLMNYPDCNDKNEYKFLLQAVPEDNELPDDYFGGISVMSNSESESELVKTIDVKSFLIGKINELKPSIYIEPFVGGSYCFQDMKPLVSNAFGTDINKDTIKSLIEAGLGDIQHFQAYDYSTWDRVLLKKDYENKCLIFCTPPLEDNEGFTYKDFISKAKRWSKSNTVVVVYSKTPKSCKEIYNIENNLKMFVL